MYQTALVFACVYFLYPCCQCFIDLNGPVGIKLTADRDTREQPLVRRSLHIIPEHMTTAALSQHRGRVVSELTTSWRGEEEQREGFYWDVSQCIIVHRASRLPVTHYGWGLLLTDFSILVWLPGEAFWWPRELQHEICNSGVLGLNPSKHMLNVIPFSLPVIPIAFCWKLKKIKCHSNNLC